MLLSLILAVSPVVQPVSSGTYRDGGTAISVRTQGETPIAPGGYSGTLFGHHRMALPYALADIINQYGLDPDVWGVDGGGVVVPVPHRATLDLQADGGSVTIETHRKYRYQAARQQTVLQTVAVANDAGITRWGNYCYHDGLYWESDGGALATCRRTSAEPNDGGWVDYCEAVPASALPAGFNIYNGNIYEIRFAWLGVHEVDWWVNGSRVRQNVFDSLLPYPYMGTATLPLRAEAHGAGRLSYICSSIASEGGQEPPTPGFSYARPTTKSVAAAAGVLPIVAIRPRQVVSYTGGSVHSHIELLPTSISCQVDNNPANVRVYLYLNPTTLTGATWAVASADNTADLDIAATAVSGGIQICTHGASEGTHDLRHVHFGISQRALRVRSLGQPADVLVVAADSVGGTQSVTCAIEWQEVR